MTGRISRGEAMARARKASDWRLLHGAAVLLVLGAFLFSVRVVLTPFTLFLLLVLLLAPYAGSRRHTLVLAGASLLLLVWLLETTGFLLAPFLLALVIAYILDPLADAFERLRIPRALAVALLALPAFGLLAVALVFGIPALADQVETLIERAPDAIRRAERWAAGARGWILGVDIPFLREELLLEPLRNLDAEQVTAFLHERREEIARRSWEAVLGLGRGVGTLLTIFGYVVLTPVLSFYLLRDYDRLAGRLVELVPRGRRERWLAFAHEYNVLLSRYLRGQVAAAAAVGVLTGTGLWIAGFPYAGLVGAVAGVFNLVPYLGLVVSIIPAVLIAVLSGSILVSLLKVAVVFAAVQLVDSTLLGPRIVGGSVGLHPVWVMLALAVGGFFFGFVGLLLAVPGAVLLKLLVRDAVARYRASAAYLAGGEAAERPESRPVETQPV